MPNFHDRYDSDGVFPVTPGCRRAVREAAALLEAAGHEVNTGTNNLKYNLITVTRCPQVLPFTPPHMYDLHATLYAHMSADDAGANTLARMHDEVWDETIGGTHRVIWQTPWTIKRLFLQSFFNLTGRRAFGQ